MDGGTVALVVVLIVVVAAVVDSYDDFAEERMVFSQELQNEMNVLMCFYDEVIESYLVWMQLQMKMNLFRIQFA